MTSSDWSLWWLYAVRSVLSDSSAVFSVLSSFYTMTVVAFTYCTSEVSGSLWCRISYRPVHKHSCVLGACWPDNWRTSSKCQKCKYCWISVGIYGVLLCSRITLAGVYSVNSFEHPAAAGMCVYLLRFVLLRAQGALISCHFLLVLCDPHGSVICVSDGRLTHTGVMHIRCHLRVRYGMEKMWQTCLSHSL